MDVCQSEKGQLVLPILAVLFLFGLFWVVYVKWCQSVYWKMRMDAAADMVALSAARDQAMQLNYMGTIQLLENPFIQKAKIFSKNFAQLQVDAKEGFNEMNGLLKMFDWKFEKEVMAVAQMVARANGANRPAIPLSSYGHQLKAEEVQIVYVEKVLPVGSAKYKPAYYTRTWETHKAHPQPPHQTWWSVCHGSICGKRGARLWLDVKPDTFGNNGGFPSPDASFLRSLGIQCFYPQFNARLLYPKFDE